MSYCQVIKGNNRSCRNYARKGLTCCYAHRKLEEVEYVAIKPEQSIKIPTSPVVKIETFEITPWDDDDLWEQIIEVAHQSPEAFADGLDWVALCSGCYKGSARFVFHKSLAKEHVLCIIMNSCKVYDAFVDQNKQLNVLMTVI